MGLDGQNQCYNLCTNNGRYCATDPDDDLDSGISGVGRAPISLGNNDDLQFKLRSLRSTPGDPNTTRRPFSIAVALNAKSGSPGASISANVGALPPAFLAQAISSRDPRVWGPLPTKRPITGAAIRNEKRSRRTNGAPISEGAETKMSHWYAGFTIGYGPWY